MLPFEAVTARREFLDGLQEGIWVADGRGSLVFANRALTGLLGYGKPEAIVGKSWRSLLPAEEVTRLNKTEPHDGVRILPDSAILCQGNRRSRAGIALARRQAGGRTWYVGSVMPLSGTGATLPADAVSRQVMDNSNDGICVVESRRITYANRRFWELTGYSAGQLHGLTIDRLVAPVNRSSITLIADEPSRIFAPVHYEVRLLNRSGQELDCELRIVPVEAESNTSLLCFFRDISKLRRVERAQTDFIATVSHELRTPLAAMKEAIGLLFDTAGDELQQRPRRYLEIAREEIDRLNRMVANLIEASRMESGKLTLQFEPVSVPELIAQSIGSLSLLITKRGLQVKEELPSELPRVLADRDRLLQVLNNLLDNAIKYSPPGGTIQVSARSIEPGTVSRYDILPDTDYVQIDVSDSGAGIPAEFLNRVFGKFERVDRHGPGIGLGLNIVQSLVHMHQGKVWVRSSLGEGTTFSFILPTKEDRG